MSESAEPNVATSLLTIHSVITRALGVAIEHSQSFSQKGFPDTVAREGFVSYVRSLVSVLHSHHLTEDDLMFPYLRDKIPEAPYDLLTSQHKEMVPILDEIKGAIEENESREKAEETLKDLHLALNKMDEMWHPHIQIEQEHFTVERADELIEMEEQIRLLKLFAEHSQKHSGPDYLVVPFILYNLSAEAREIMARSMPPEVTEQLVPIFWREKWEPMKPFLLD